jgi:hypothetical protein
MKNEIETGFGVLAVLTREMLVDAGANRAFRRLCGAGVTRGRRGAAPAERFADPRRGGRERRAA